MSGKSLVGLRGGAALALVGLLLPAVAAADDRVEQAGRQRSAALYTWTAPDGETYFALALDPGALPAAGRTREHVVLVDTSASQIGEHRRQAHSVLREFLTSLPADDQVALFALDVRAEGLTDGFVPASDPAVAAALQTLQRRAPLGATNLPAGLSAALELETADGQPASVVYIGDGMSMANLIDSPEMARLLEDLIARRSPVHSYAVGPQTDLQFLGILAQHTGGMVFRDRIDGRSDDPGQAGQKLAAAAAAPVFRPEAITIEPAVDELFPAAALPMRADRQTVYIGRGWLEGELQVSVSGVQDDQPQSLTWTVSTDEAQDGNTFLGVFFRRAEATDGLAVPFAGASLLEVARQDFDEHVDRMLDQGEHALRSRQIPQAEQIGLAVREVDPQNVRAAALVGAANRVKAPAIAQANPNGAVRTAFQPPGESLLDDPQFGPGVAPAAPAALPPAQDLIAEEELRRRLREQQLTLQVNRTIDEARRLAVDAPDAGLGVLERALTTAQGALDIHPDVRQQLLRRLQSVRQEVRAQMEIAELRMVQAQERLAQIEAEQRLIDQLRRDEEKLQTLIDQVRAALTDAARGDDDAYEEAELIAQAAVNLRPGEGTAAAARFTSEVAGQVSKTFRLRALRNDRLLETLYQVELSHVPFPDEPPALWPPADVWQALTERRRIWRSVDLHRNSPSEERIQQALREETQVEFIDTPLSEVIEFISTLHNIPIILDEAALQDEGYTTDEPISQVLAGITLRSALKIILEPYDLTYVIQDEVMKITTQLVADEIMSTRVYPVGDLVMPINPMMLQMMGGMGMGGMGMMGGMGGMMGNAGMGMGGMGGMGMGGMGMGMGGMGMFSVPPETPAQPFRLDNQAVESLKKKPDLNR